MRSFVSPLRKAIFAFGLLVMLSLLLQPVCKAYEGQHQPDGGPACCLDMPPDAVAAAPSAGGEKPVLSSFATVRLLPGIALATTGISERLAAWTGPPPPSQSYYARSTRIQR
jgi:hypothetical protein